MLTLMLSGLNIGSTGPYLILGIQALITFVFCYLLAYDTTFRDLDKDNEDMSDILEMEEYKKF